MIRNSVSASLKLSPLKSLFTANDCWAGLLETGGLREVEVESVSKMLACGTSILGVKHRTCGNGRCPHVEYLCNTCHCRACPSCGKKATAQWVALQNNRLPDCPWHPWCSRCPTRCGQCSSQPWPARRVRVGRGGRLAGW